MNIKNNYLTQCPHCGLKPQYVHEDVVTEIDYCSVFDNWIEMVHTCLLSYLQGTNNVGVEVVMSFGVCLL